MPRASIVAARSIDASDEEQAQFRASEKPHLTAVFSGGTSTSHRIFKGSGGSTTKRTLLKYVAMPRGPRKFALRGLVDQREGPIELDGVPELVAID